MDPLSSSDEGESLLNPCRYVGRASSINNPGGGLLHAGSSGDNTPTASVTYSSIQVEPRKLYRRRWYCLLLYCILSFVFGICNTALGPIAHAVQRAFFWNNADIALVSSLPTLAFVFTVAPCTVLLDTKGLRVACLFSAFCMVLGSGIRCIFSEPPWCKWSMNIGQLTLGVASSAVYSASTTFSNVWFPADQRTSATSISAIGSGLGLGFGSLLGPLLVKVQWPHHNVSFLSTPTPLLASNTTGVPSYILKMRTSIMNLMYLQFGLTIVVLVAMLVYFPAKPPTPPSTSAAYDRVNVRRGMVALFRHHQFWIVAAIFSLSTGVSSGFAGVLDVNLEAAHVAGDQLTSGWMLLGSAVASVVACILISILADRFRHQTKRMLTALFIVSTALFVWFALTIQGILPISYVTLYISFIVGSLIVFGCMPVFLELACDSAYPISEGLTTGVLNILCNTTSLIFLYILMIPGVGTQWMNWAMVGSAALCVPLLLQFTPSTGRLAVDIKRPLEDSDETNTVHSYGVIA